MPRLLQGVVSPGSAVTHEGAAAFDLSHSDPLTHLTFTKGATLFTDTFYRTQAEEVFAYARALVAAERHEPGFGWKFAAYMRDPKKGKGNRIQGSLAPAILAAADPDGPFTAEYAYQCLRHRADDAVLFAAHFANLELGDVPPAARAGMGRALSEMDEYQLLKYARKQFPLLRERGNGKPASLRLVDALGIARAHLTGATAALYRYLHAPTRARAELVGELPLTAARRRFFRGGPAEDFVAGRLSVEQALSYQGSTREAWEALLGVPGLLPDVAFKQYVRAMHLAGLPVKQLVEQARGRRFAGVWPHQVYAGYQAARHGSRRFGRGRKVRFERGPAKGLTAVFDAVLEKVAANLLPSGPCLGIADVSGSMFGPRLGGDRSSVNVGDAAVTLAAMMARGLGYAATFSDTIFVKDLRKGESPLRFADRLKKGPGMGSTQVAGSVVALIKLLLKETDRPRPRTLFFFSDMQFHPAGRQTVAAFGLPETVREYFRPTVAPLRAALRAYTELLGPVDVVLWNLAAYDAAPLPSGTDGVLMLAGFDANSFRHVSTWQESGSRAVRGRDTESEAVRDAAAELDYIRTF
jgi:hypothetical protein